jgi:hypothetical protein
MCSNATLARKLMQNQGILVQSHPELRASENACPLDLAGMGFSPIRARVGKTGAIVLASPAQGGGSGLRPSSGSAMASANTASGFPARPICGRRCSGSPCHDCKMPDEPPSPTLDRKLTTKVVAAYVRRNQIGSADQLLVLISTVHQGARRSRKIESQSSPKHAARNTT